MEKLPEWSLNSGPQALSQDTTTTPHSYTLTTTTTTTTTTHTHTHTHTNGCTHICITGGQQALIIGPAHTEGGAGVTLQFVH